jgi:hypothetical protein
MSKKTMSKKGRARTSERSRQARGRVKELEYRDSFWDRMPASRQHMACILVLAAAALIFFVPYHLDGRTFIGHDVIQWRAGTQSINEARAEFDEEPLWATNMFAGMPATVISHARQFPGLDNTLLPAANFMYPIAQYWILLFGAYLLFVLLGFRPLHAVIGAVLVGFTTYIPIIVGAGHNTKFWSYVYLQWVMVGYVMVTRRPQWRWVGLAVFVLALSLQLRQSHPQVTYYFLYLFVAWWVFDMIRARRAGSLRSMGLSTAILAGAVILAALTVLQPYWAIMEYTPHSIRGASDIAEAGGLDIDYAFVWSQGWAELLTLVIPNLYGGAELYWGPKPMTSGPHYFGAIAFLLFVIGMIRGRHPLKWLFFGVGLLAMAFSLGKHFPALNAVFFDVIPGFNRFRTPEMWLMLTAVCFTLVSLAGLGWIVSTTRSEGGRATLRGLVLPLGVAAGFALLMLLLVSTMFSFQKPGEVEMLAQQVAAQAGVSPEDPRAVQTAEQYVQSELTPQRADLARADAIRFLIFVVLGVGAILLGVSAKIPMSFAVMALVVLTMIDMLGVGERYAAHNLPSRGVEAEDIIRSRERPLDRFIQNNIASEESWPYRVLPLADNPFNNAIPAYFYPSIGGYTGAKMGSFQDLIDRALFSGPVGINRPVLDMLNVRFISHVEPLPLPGWRQAYAGEDGVVMENTEVLPKAFFVDSLVTVARPIDALVFVAEGAFDPAVVAVVETAEPLATVPDATSEARVRHYSPRLIEIETEREVDGFLVLSEVYYPPGWAAEVDGVRVPIYKTNYVLRGIPVPAGSHTARLNFDPPSYVIGRPITYAAHIVMWLSIIGLLGLAFRRRREIVSSQDIDNPDDHS